MKLAKSTLLASAFALTAWLPAGDLVIKDGDSIAFLGDSITQLGWSQKPNGYVNLVVEGLKQAGVDVTPIPAGIGGNTSKNMLDRLQKDVIDKKPVWMTLNCGINDSPKMEVDEFAANIRKIVEQAEAAGIKPVLMTTTIGSGENIDSAECKKRLTFANEFKKLAQEKGLILVDLNTTMEKALRERQSDKSVKGLKLTYDGTHLNGAGNQIVALEILKTLGVSEKDLEILRARWAAYPFAEGQPELSLTDYAKFKAAADKKGVSVEALVSETLTEAAK